MNIQVKSDLSENGAIKSDVQDVIIVGAGFSGVCMGIKLHEAGIKDFVILEKTAGIGGTWYKNTYPGAACDVPSHFYCFSFAPNPDWSRVYSGQAEIRDYIEKCANDYGVTPHIRFNSEVKAFVFDEKEALWTVSLPDGSVIKARHLVLGSGGLNTPSIPALKGMEDYEGPAFHTATWRSDVDLKDKNVVVVGSAASAVQAVPELAKICKKVTMFQRTPNYVLPRMDRAYTDKEKAAFRNHTWKQKLTRWRMFWRFELVLSPMFKRKSKFRERIQKKVKKYIRSAVKDPALAEKLVPNYDLGCKRILISDDFYASLNRDNVDVNTDGIDHFVSDGIIDKTGKKVEADAVVFATGFDLQKQMLSIDLIGRNGASLNQLWSENATAYNGCMVSGFPNAYFVTGPNTGVGSTSIVFMVEAQIKFIMDCLKLSGQSKLIEPKQDVMEYQNDVIQHDLENTVWAGSCQSWYKDENGRIHTLYPHTARKFLKERKKLKTEDFLIEEKTKEQIAG